MIELVRRNSQFLLILLGWLLVGKVGGVLVGTGVSVLVLLYFWTNKAYAEAFLGLLLLAMLASSVTFPFAKTARNIYMLLLCGIMLAENFQKIIDLSAFYRHLGIFFLYSLPLLLLSETPLISAQKNISFILLYLCIPPLFYVLMKQDGERMIQLFYFIILSFYVIGIVLYFAGYSDTIRINRYRGLMGNPNEIGMFSVISTIFILMIRESFPGIISKKWLYLLLVCALATLALCGSRSSLMATALFLLIWRLKFNWASSLFLSVLLYFVSDYILDGVLYFVNLLGLQEYSRLESLDAAGGRVHGWSYAWEHINKNFIFGKGWVYDEYIFKLGADELKKLNHQGGVHNSFLGIWLNTGVIGILLFVTGIVRLFYTASKNSRLALPTFCTMLLLANFEPWMQSSLSIISILMVVILTLLIHLNELAEEEEYPEEEAGQEEQQPLTEVIPT